MDPNQPPPPSSAPRPREQFVVLDPPPANAWGIIGLILSILGLVGMFGGCLCFPIALIGLLCPVGAALGGIGMRQENKGLAVAALIVGLIGTAILLAFVVLFAVGIAGSSMNAGSRGF